MNTLWKTGVVTIVLSCWVAVASATPITCQPQNERLATLDSATACMTGNDENIHSPQQVSDLFGGEWVKAGELTGNGTNGLFSVSLTSGTWGTSDVAGDWFIDSSFWSLYGMAVITMHVGQGNGNPDYFAWAITKGETQGTFSYKDLDGKGGGLSNLFLFGGGTPAIFVPESGLSMLFVMGLAAVFFTRRRVTH